MRMLGLQPLTHERKEVGSHHGGRHGRLRPGGASLARRAGAHRAIQPGRTRAGRVSGSVDARAPAASTGSQKKQPWGIFDVFRDASTTKSHSVTALVSNGGLAEPRTGAAARLTRALGVSSHAMPAAPTSRGAACRRRGRRFKARQTRLQKKTHFCVSVSHSVAQQERPPLLSTPPRDVTSPSECPAARQSAAAAASLARARKRANLHAREDAPPRGPPSAVCAGAFTSRRTCSRALPCGRRAGLGREEAGNALLGHSCAEGRLGVNCVRCVCCRTPRGAGGEVEGEHGGCLGSAWRGAVQRALRMAVVDGRSSAATHFIRRAAGCWLVSLVV